MHVDAERLALLALGDPADVVDEQAHLRRCPACAARLAALEQVRDLARGAAGFRLVEPSPRVWDAVRSGIESRRTGGTSGGVTARARLAPVATRWSGASGDAEVATDPRGRRLLQLTLHADLPATGLRQAWLLDHGGRRQTVGVLDGAFGLWTVDRAVDLGEFAVLEVSQQEVGSIEHSGETIVRGPLVAVS